MNKVLSILVALIVATPLMAGVTIDCNYPQDESGIVEVYYTASDAADLVRAFALDIELSAGEIVAITDFDPNYPIYPGSIDIVGGAVNDWGTPIATGTGALTGTGQATLEMGSLYEAGDDANTPGVTGLLCKIEVSENCTLEITGNATRGNVVFESGASTDVYAAATIDDIAPVGCQTCLGDINGNTAVEPGDYGIMISMLNSAAAQGFVIPSTDPRYNICADLNQNTAVEPGDYGILISMLNAAAAQGFVIPCAP